MSTIAANFPMHAAASANPARLVRIAAYFAATAIAVLLFEADATPTLEIGVSLLGATTLWGLWSLRMTQLSLLPRMMLLLYAAPFSATVGYLFNPDYVWWQTPLTVRLCQNHALMADLVWVGLAGMLGLLLGMELGALWGRAGIGPMATRPNSTTLPRLTGLRPVAIRHPTLNLPVFLALTALAIFLSWLFAPKETILVAAYASADQSTGAATELNFNSAFLVSYIMLVALVIDAEREPARSWLRRFKLLILLGSIGYIVIVLQMLRGDRECSGLLAALAALYLTSHDARHFWQEQRRMVWRRMARLSVPLGIAVTAFLLLGAVRSWASATADVATSVNDQIFQIATENTWTAVALTNLGLASDIHFHRVEFLYGATYFEYILSLPPGFLADALGYVRPLSLERGPNWWYIDISAGGIHAIVVPYRNFGMAGACLVMALWGALISACEVRNTTCRFLPRLLYGTLMTCSFLWFWYGDLNIIRGAIIALVFFVIYGFAARVRQ